MKLEVEPYVYVTNTPKGRTEQLHELNQFAQSIFGNVVEIGSFLGRATQLIAKGLSHGHKGTVFTIDPHEGNDRNYRKLISVINNCVYKDHIRVIRDFSYNVLKLKEPKELFENPVDLIFIDGNHWYKDVKQDTDWIKIVRSGGIVAFHDYCYRWQNGVVRAVKEYCDENNDIKFLKLVGSLLIFKKL